MKPNADHFMKKMLLMASLLVLVLAGHSSSQVYTGAEKPEGVVIEAFESVVPLEWTGCPSFAIPENEPPIPDGGEDVINGGCNSTPPVFSPIQIGDVICGAANQYNAYSSRDTDWYRLVLTEAAHLYWTGTANFPLTLFIIEGPCPATLLSNAIIPAGEVGQTDYMLSPGEYYFWAGPSSWGPGYEGDYLVTLTEGPPSDTWYSEPPSVPLSAMAVYVGIGLILALTVFRFRHLL
ncbi:MAG: hypothetical protein R6U86_04450 [Bacteroidales bacterium]